MDQNQNPNQNSYQNGQYFVVQEEFNPEIIGQPKAKNGLSVAALVLGIVGLLFSCCCWPFGLVAAILALIFALVSRKNTGNLNGKALAGLIMAIIALLICVFAIVNLATGIGALSDLFNNEEFMKEYEKFFEEFYKEYGGEISDEEVGATIVGLLGIG